MQSGIVRSIVSIEHLTLTIIIKLIIIIVLRGLVRFTRVIIVIVTAIE